MLILSHHEVAVVFSEEVEVIIVLQLPLPERISLNRRKRIRLKLVNLKNSRRKKKCQELRRIMIEKSSNLKIRVIKIRIRGTVHANMGLLATT